MGVAFQENPQHLRRLLLLWKQGFGKPGMLQVNRASGAWQSVAQMPEGHSRESQASDARKRIVSSQLC